MRVIYKDSMQSIDVFTNIHLKMKINTTYILWCLRQHIVQIIMFVHLYGIKHTLFSFLNEPFFDSCFHL